MASSLLIVLLRMLILIIIIVTTIIPVVTSFTTVQRQSSSLLSSLTISSGNVDTTTTICTTSSQIQNVVNKNTRFYKVLLLSSSQEQQQQQQQQDDEFTKFAGSLLENDNNSNSDGITTRTFVNKVNGDTKAIMEGSTKSEINTATRSTTATKTTRTPFVSQQPKQVPTPKKSTTTTTTTNNNNSQIWQAELETLLAFDPTVPISKRQQSFYNLLNANEQIRTATIKALQNRNIDPLLTPTQRKLQEGTRAVARQVTDDIIPSIVETVRQGSTAAVIGTTGSSTSSSSSIISPNDVTRIGGRMFNAFNTQIRQNLQTFAGDVMNPSRIPQRISQQTEDIVKEVQNVFAETPIGLKGPKYTVVYSTDSYEVRDYEQYNVATTTMGTIQDPDPTTPKTKSVDIWSLTEQGAAFNTLASYIFGANKQQLVMDMTTPVTTTMTGEMRFYVDVPIPPEPIQPQQDDNNNNNKQQQQQPQFLEQARQQSRTNISIETIPPSRLAVRKFTGFVTAGEVQRQKDALLTAIAFDENYIQLDIPHGSTVGHVIFQYNPPYTIPFIRRNEIAIPVTLVNYTE